MSTIASSASPAASPRASGYAHYASNRRPCRSPVINKTPPTTSPSSTFHRSSSGSRPVTAIISSNAQQSPRFQAKVQYTDAGTQYSPEGLPPTAPADTSAAPASRNKRKQPESPPMPASTRAEATPAAPSEPILRETPQPSDPPTEPNSANDAVPIPTEERATAASVMQKRAKTDPRGLKIMPRKYETCDPKDLGVLIADMLMELIRLNDKIPLKDGKLTRFHSRAPPGISCHDYLNRLIQHATLSPPILLSMVYYIDRLCALYPAFTIGSLTVHRFLITAATVASKGLSDSFWTNPTYARIGGISTSELATLELDFLQRVNFRIVPKPETLVDYYVSLVQRSQGYRLEDESPSPEPMEEDTPG